MSVHVKLNFSALDRKADQALLTVSRAVGERAQRLIGQRVWSWPRTTPRHNGTVAGTRRNIVDEGELRASQSEPVRVRPGVVEITWSAPYSAAVFMGAVFRKRAASLPARNAPRAAINQTNLAAAFARAWRQE